MLTAVLSTRLRWGVPEPLCHDRNVHRGLVQRVPVREVREQEWELQRQRVRGRSGNVHCGPVPGLPLQLERPRDRSGVRRRGYHVSWKYSLSWRRDVAVKKWKSDTRSGADDRIKLCVTLLAVDDRVCKHWMADVCFGVKSSRDDPVHKAMPRFSVVTGCQDGVG